ncbi:MAG TPA: hypothetical protein ENN25_02580 [Euryarchaeota archaeon]|nr:hypothetical protein [Euryarchaeota archaeon]
MPRLRRHRDDDEPVDRESKVTIIKRAFRLGFEVGYRDHREGIGWVKRERSTILREANQIGTLDECKIYYHRGKELGKRRRLQKLSIGESVPAVEYELPSEMRNFEQRIFDESAERSFQDAPRVVEPPMIFDPPRVSRMPRLFRMFRLFKM